MLHSNKEDAWRKDVEMDLVKDMDISRMLNMKLHSITELSTIMKDWDASADYENEVAFSANLQKRQELIDKVILLNRELSNVVHSEDISISRYTLSDMDLIRKTNEILQQIQELNNRGIEQTKKNKDFYLSEAKRCRQGKNGLAAYMKNGLSTRSKQYDLRG